VNPSKGTSITSLNSLSFAFDPLRPSDNQIVGIRYFSAIVKADPSDPLPLTALLL
jgi:hypothetical protein